MLLVIDHYVSREKTAKAWSAGVLVRQQKSQPDGFEASRRLLRKQCHSTIAACLAQRPCFRGEAEPLVPFPDQCRSARH